MSDIVCVKSYSTRLEADLAKGLLVSNDIKAFVTADDEGTMAAPFVYGNKGVQVFVRQEDLKIAQDILVTQKESQAKTK